MVYFEILPLCRNRANHFVGGNTSGQHTYRVSWLVSNFPLRRKNGPTDAPVRR